MAVSRASLSNVDSAPSFDSNSASDEKSFEIGASFPSSKVSGAVRYRKTYGDIDTAQGFSRNHLGVEGEVKIEKDIYFKAGYERVNSISSSSRQSESNLWTGIEVNF